MKQLSSTLNALAFCFLAFSATAAPVTPEQALARLESAPAAMRKAAPLRGTPMTLVAQLPEIYVFSSGEGFAVLPADDVAPALLGYSESGVFVEENPALKWWMEQYAAQIRAASGAPQHQMMRVSRDPIEPMVKTHWNQGDPYDQLTPVISGRHAPTGCVATCMAQMMRYYSWPEKGVGTHSYNMNGETLSFDFAGTTFDWANMTYYYTSSSTEAEKQAVATLMYAAGVSVDMQYTASESGAVSRDMGKALIEYFNYDKGLWMPQRDYYGIAEWEEMIYSELAAGRPVPYGGTGSAGGHQFICDGYSADGYFHFNWGWGGLSDGYFLLTALDPPSLGTGGGAGGFNYNQVVVLGMQKPKADSKPTYIMYCSGFAPSTGSTTKGTTIEFGNGFYNYSFVSTPVGTQVGLIITPSPAANAEPVYVTALSGSIQSGYGARTLAAAIPATLTDGVYTITPGYKVPDGEWTAMRAPLSENASLTATVKGNTVSFSAPSAPQIEVSDLTLQTALYWGSPFELTFQVTNTGDTEYYGAVIPALISADGKSLEATSTTYPVDLLAGASEAAKYSGTFASQSSTVPAAGTYLLGLITSDGRLVGEPVSVELKAQPATTTLEVRSLKMIDEATLRDGSTGSVSFEFEVECTAGYYAGAVTIAVFPSTGGSSLAAGSSDTVYLEAGQSVTAVATLDLTELGVGEYMAAPFVGQQQVGSATSFAVEPQPLAIEDVDTPLKPAAIYDLQGRRVLDPLPGRIYLTRNSLRRY